MTALADVLHGPTGAQIVAFFDFDGTLVDGYSGDDVWDRLRRGQLGPVEFLRSAVAGIDYRTRAAEGTRLFPQTVRAWQDLVDLGERLFRSAIAGRVYPEARELVATHREMGHTVVLASSATRYQAATLARDLDLDHVLCSAIAVEDGVVTGRVSGPILWGEGKAAAVRAYAVEHDIDLAGCYGYGNGDEAVPFLSAVGHPRPLNPGMGLARIAAERGWPVRQLRGRSRPTVLEIARTGAAIGAIGATLAVGAGIGALNGNRRQTANLVSSIGPQTALAVAGIDFDVTGEEHLWSHRPAVFIFNHQSVLDVVILGRLLRRDVTGVVKMEAARDPIFAPIGKLLDVAYVDRGNREQARAALEPVRQRLAAGISVAIAPEGTRSVTPRLGAFKKGAFHIAMQAGVPLVPIVIRNAGDLMWKRSLIVRSGTLHVVALPPVPTHGWTVETLDERVTEIRQQFVHTLAAE
ncbi:MAG: HAD-IB family hydrolase [Geodermatophilaceae bacterium]|nr:HAD-IB family hydrolase [Geodermatophilaceae bacterium]